MTEVPELLTRLAVTCTALTIVGTACWWFVGPRVREFLRAQQRAADVVSGGPGRPDVAALISDQGARLDLVISRLDSHDGQLVELRARQDAVDQRLADWHAQAAAELSLTRAARILAAGSNHQQPI